MQKIKYGFRHNVAYIFLDTRKTGGGDGLRPEYSLINISLPEEEEQNEQKGKEGF